MYRFRVLIFILGFMTIMSSAAAPMLPESGFAWRNESLNSSKTTVYTFHIADNGLMWMGTNDGLYFFDGVDTHPVGRKVLKNTQIYSIVEQNGKLFLGTNNGLYIYDSGEGRIRGPENNSPMEIRALKLIDGKLWIGSLYGVSVFSTGDSHIQTASQGLPNDAVYSFLYDSRGNLYAGTYNGLAIWNPAKETFSSVEAYTGNSRNLFVNCLVEAPGNESIYVGTEGNLFRYYPRTGLWEKVREVEGNNIKSLTATKSGHLMVGSDNGIFDLIDNHCRHYRHDSRNISTLADNEIWCVYCDDNENIWAGHERGFSVASNSPFVRTVNLGLLTGEGEGNDIHAIHRDKQGNLWVGGTNGVIKIDPRGNSRWFRHSDSFRSLSHNRIRGIYEDEESLLWLLTDGGLNRYNHSSNDFDRFNIYDANGDFNCNWTYAMTREGDYYWIGSYLGGLHAINRSRFKGPGRDVPMDFSFDSFMADTGEHLSNNLINNIISDNKGNIWILLFRDDKITRFSPSTHSIKHFNIHEATGEYPTGIALDNEDNVWCTYNRGCMLLRGDSLTVIPIPQGETDESVTTMGTMGNTILVASNNNLWRVSSSNTVPVLFPVPRKNYSAIYYDDLSGNLILGGIDEITEIDYNHIAGNIPDKSIKMVLEPSDTAYYDLSDRTSQHEGIDLPYRGSLTLLVSTLDYTPETVHRYSYRLAKSPTDTLGPWISLPEGVNTIALTDLSMGNYMLLVKDTGSQAPVFSLPVKVAAPFYLSWWMLAIYAVFLAGIVVGIIILSRRRNRRILKEEERKKTIENVEKKLTFLSNVSHDLKTPLSMILGPVSLLKEKADDTENRRTLETIYDNAVKLNNLIHRTISLNRINNDDENLLILSSFDVVEFCRGIVFSFRDNNPQKKFIFHTECSRLFIEADAVKLESVMNNLLSNACKYSQEGATVSVAISRKEDNVEIVVADDGMGIPEQDQPLIFQRMFRSPAAAGLKEGTGIGLYLIKKFLELMKGNIDMYSREGQGTTFIVTLPLKESVAENGDAEADSGNCSAKILIVEDNAQIAAFIKDYLKNEYACVTADNGRTGLAIASSINPDLMIIDEMMPVMKGLEMVKLMKQNPRLASTPIIMLTARNDNETENESVKLGIDVFMAKPFEPALLLGRIRHLLKMRRELVEAVRIESLTEAKPIVAESATEKQLARIAKIIEDNITDPDLNVNMLCEKSSIPNKQLYRIIKKYMGMSPVEYIRTVRLKKAAMLFEQHRFTVSEVCYMVGFKTPSYFTKCFQEHFGVNPSNFTGTRD